MEGYEISGKATLETLKCKAEEILMYWVAVTMRFPGCGG